MAFLGPLDGNGNSKGAVNGGWRLIVQLVLPGRGRKTKCFVDVVVISLMRWPDGAETSDKAEIAAVQCME